MNTLLLSQVFGIASLLVPEGAPAAGDCVMSRWAKLQPVRVQMHVEQSSHTVPAQGDVWDQATWEPYGQGITRDLELRGFGDNWDLRMVSITHYADGREGSMTEWMSHIYGEFVLLNDPASRKPWALIDGEVRSSSLMVDKLLTLIEAEFFDDRRPWQNVFTDNRCVFVQDERVGELDCWKFENQANTEATKIEMWFAPSLGCAPVRARRTGYYDGGRKSSFSDYCVFEHQLAGDVYVPRTAAIIVAQPDERPDAHVHEYRVELLGFGRDSAPQSLRNSLPSNTVVNDFLKKEEYRIGEGQVLDRKPLDLKELAAIEDAIVADLGVKELRSSRRTGMVGILGIAIALVAALIITKKRMTRSA